MDPDFDNQKWNLAAVFKPRSVLPIDEVHLELYYPPAPIYRESSEEYTIDVGRKRYLEALTEISKSGCVREPSMADVLSIIREIRERPFNVAALEDFSCTLDILVSKKTSDITIIAQGSDGVVARGLLGDDFDIPEGAPPFVVKVALSEDDVSSMNEAVVGLYCTNKLRKLIPNFMYVYNFFNCNRPIISNTTISTCPLDTFDETIYTMVETIADSDTFATWITKHQNESDFMTRIHILILQIVLSLSVARDKFDFSHNDLHTGNVMIRKLPAPRTLVYRIKNSTYYVEVEEIATLIDFGRSHARIPIDELPAVIQYSINKLPNYGVPGYANFKEGKHINVGLMWAGIGISPFRSETSYDIARIVDTCALRIDNSINAREVFSWLRPLFRDEKIYETLRAYRSFWGGDPYYTNMPPSVDFLPQDLVRAVLPTLPEQVRERVSLSIRKPGMAPLFSCEEDVCAV